MSCLVSRIYGTINKANDIYLGQSTLHCFCPATLPTPAIPTSHRRAARLFRAIYASRSPFYSCGFRTARHTRLPGRNGCEAFWLISVDTLRCPHWTDSRDYSRFSIFMPGHLASIRHAYFEWRGSAWSCREQTVEFCETSCQEPKIISATGGASHRPSYCA